MTNKHVHATVEPAMINHTRIYILECDSGDVPTNTYMLQ